MAWQTAAYVRSLGRARARVRLPGNAQRGAALYRRRTAAASATSSADAADALGPELTASARCAARRTCATRSSNRKPRIHRATSSCERVPTTAGAEVRGIRVNEDVFWIHVRDARRNGAHAAEVGPVARSIASSRRTLMPSYARDCPPRELDDLVAYLATLRGDR